MGSLKISVCVSTDYLFPLDVNPASTIMDLITHILHFRSRKLIDDDDETKDASDLPSDQCLLLFRGLNLLDHPTSTVGQWGMDDNEELILCLKGSFNLRVQKSDTESFLLQVETLETVTELKEKIHKEMGIPVEDQDLYYCYTLMGDDSGTPAKCSIFNRRSTKSDISDDFCYDVVLGFCPNKEALRSEITSSVSRFQQASSDIKIIVESPATVGTVSSIFLGLAVNGNDTIATLRTRISDTFRKDERDSPLALIIENPYIILFNRKVLEDETLTLDQCEIRDGDRIMVCPNVSSFVTVIFVPAEVPYEKKLHEVPVLCSDTVGTLKTKIIDLEGTSPQKMLLRFEEEWLADDEMLLLEYGLVDLPQTAEYIYSYSHLGRDYLVEALIYA